MEDEEPSWTAGHPHGVPSLLGSGLNLSRFLQDLAMKELGALDSVD